MYHHLNQPFKDIFGYSHSWHTCTSLLRKARAASGGGTYSTETAVSRPSSVGMVPSRVLLYKKLLRAADEAVPPQRREEGEPPPRRAAPKCARSKGFAPPRRPPQQQCPQHPSFCRQKVKFEGTQRVRRHKGLDPPPPYRGSKMDIPRRIKY